MSGLRPGDTSAETFVVGDRVRLRAGGTHVVRSVGDFAFGPGYLIVDPEDESSRGWFSGLALERDMEERGRCAWNAIPVPGAPNQERCAAACAKKCGHVNPCFCAAHDPELRPSDDKEDFSDADLTRARAWIYNFARICQTGVRENALAREFADARREAVAGLRPSDTEADLIARERSIPQLCDDIVATLEARDTHRMKHIAQLVGRIRRAAEGGDGP